MLLIAGLMLHYYPDIACLGCSPALQAKEINGGKTMSFGIYIVGYLILIIGLAIGANMLHLPPKWIGVGILCMVGVAILHGVTVTRQKDASS
jgi:protein-S-isoprenylcysteine O-methyltransferase Ste14